MGATGAKVQHKVLIVVLNNAVGAQGARLILHGATGAQGAVGADGGGQTTGAQGATGCRWI